MDARECAERAVQELLSADTVLPEQFWGSEGGSFAPTGERGLMWAVFADGIDCYRRNAHATSLRQRTEFKEAEYWVFCTDWDWPFSFVNLCEAFGFDPTAVRGALERWKGGRTSSSFRRQRFRPAALHAA